MPILVKKILQKIDEFNDFKDSFSIIIGDIIERNEKISFNQVDIKQYGKVVNIVLELDCSNISLTEGQVIIGKLSGVTKRKIG